MATVKVINGNMAAAIGASSTRHLPSAPAVVLSACPANVTVTASPGSAQPQTGAATSRCNTMLSPMTRAKRTSPTDTDGNIETANAALRDNSFFMARKN